MQNVFSDGVAIYRTVAKLLIAPTVFFAFFVPANAEELDDAYYLSRPLEVPPRNIPAVDRSSWEMRFAVHYGRANLTEPMYLFLGNAGGASLNPL